MVMTSMEPLPGELLQNTHARGKGRPTLNVILVILLATLSVSMGETLLRAGMKAVGEGNHGALGFVLAAVSNWHVLVGVALMAIYFGLYSFALSQADISFVLPFTGLSYLFVAVFARIFLHEPVSPTRWIGAGIIVLGVIVVGKGG